MRRAVEEIPLGKATEENRRYFEKLVKELSEQEIETRLGRALGQIPK